MSDMVADLDLGVRRAIALQERRLEYASAWLAVRDDNLERLLGAKTEGQMQRHDARAHRGVLMAKAWSMIHQGKIELGRGDPAKARDCARLARQAYRHARILVRQWGFR